MIKFKIWHIFALTVVIAGMLTYAKALYQPLKHYTVGYDSLSSSKPSSVHVVYSFPDRYGWFLINSGYRDVVAIYEFPIEDDEAEYWVSKNNTREYLDQGRMPDKSVLRFWSFRPERPLRFSPKYSTHRLPETDIDKHVIEQTWK